ncbi:MAG: hypothetical protein AAF394_07240 [Planctomycetota bacterium]
MNFLDFSEQSIGIRLLAAATILVTLAGIAAGAVVAAMMMVLFSVEGPGRQLDETALKWAMWTLGGSLGIAVLMPPVLVLCKASPSVTLLPAGIGFVLAGFTTLWFVVQNLGS